MLSCLNWKKFQINIFSPRLCLQLAGQASNSLPDFHQWVSFLSESGFRKNMSRCQPNDKHSLMIEKLQKLCPHNFANMQSHTLFPPHSPISFQGCRHLFPVHLSHFAALYTGLHTTSVFFILCISPRLYPEVTSVCVPASKFVLFFVPGFCRPWCTHWSSAQ